MEVYVCFRRSIKEDMINLNREVGVKIMRLVIFKDVIFELRCQLGYVKEVKEEWRKFKDY